ncbi:MULTISPECIES: Pr6Pr family membrane protein [unclassified Streptomyces]|uniref:Pr6Pr family membrane protein n=1 Tax=unclassified Streptomyces TaxID=2593676 RepID=UPI0033A2233B
MTAPIPKDIPDLPAITGVPALIPSAVPASAVVAPVRRPLAAVFRLLVALAATAGVTIDLMLGSPARVLSYFTIQSNILVAVVFTAAAARAWSARRPLPPLVTGGTLLFIVTTGLVYHLILTNASSPFSMTGEVAALTGWPALANQILHTVIPIAALLDWLLLTSPPPLALRHAPVWLLYPLAYLAFSLARGELLPSGTTARYLYPFLDVDQHGYKGILSNALLLGLAIYALALLLIALDHIRPDPIRRRAKTGFRLRPPVG